MLDLFWVGGNGSKDLPSPVHMHLVSSLHLPEEKLTGLRAVLHEGFVKGKAVTFFRIFNPTSSDEAWRTRDFTYLDEKPELILYEGYWEGTGENLFLEDRTKPEHQSAT